MKLPPVSGKKVHLVPFESWMVPRYRQWMDDVEIRRLTSTDDSFADNKAIEAMRIRWNSEPALFNFIIVAREALPPGLDAQVAAGVANYHEPDFQALVRTLPIEALVGDIGLFYIEEGGEISFMIAERGWRRRGLGADAVHALQSLPLPTDRLIAKVSVDNAPALGLFTRLGYQVDRKDDVLEEVHLSLSL
ncbi:MAG: uncharacterized protein KVP18_004432 [Porospora cf. gigantea A]|uniref:uncharacterized protein n=1 Tax=Porospora cf. gigantea A TaxID=2853593 RepID=UPI00355972C6|nr:MAG: hypothetical protein KVP18_004432 [Porospora cf. gigantea A]